MDLIPEHKTLVRMAAAKWKGKTIKGPSGEFTVNCVYYTSPGGGYDGKGGWMEAILFPKGGGRAVTAPLLVLKRDYQIIG